MMTSLKENVHHFFSYLFDRWGFKLAVLADDLNGNVLIAESKRIRIRFINDRADFFLDITRVNEPDSWIGFYEIMDRLASAGVIEKNYKYANKIAPVSRLLHKHLPEVEKMLTKD